MAPTSRPSKPVGRPLDRLIFAPPGRGLTFIKARLEAFDTRRLEHLCVSRYGALRRDPIPHMKAQTAAIVTGTSLQSPVVVGYQDPPPRSRTRGFLVECYVPGPPELYPSEGRYTGPPIYLNPETGVWDVTVVNRDLLPELPPQDSCDTFYAAALAPGVDQETLLAWGEQLKHRNTYFTKLSSVMTTNGRVPRIWINTEVRVPLRNQNEAMVWSAALGLHHWLRKTKQIHGADRPSFAGAYATKLLREFQDERRAKRRRRARRKAGPPPSPKPTPVRIVHGFPGINGDQ